MVLDNDVKVSTFSEELDRTKGSIEDVRTEVDVLGNGIDYVKEQQDGYVRANDQRFEKMDTRITTLEEGGLRSKEDAIKFATLEEKIRKIEEANKNLQVENRDLREKCERLQDISMKLDKRVEDIEAPLKAFAGGLRR